MQQHPARPSQTSPYQPLPLAAAILCSVLASHSALASTPTTYDVIIDGTVGAGSYHYSCITPTCTPDASYTAGSSYSINVSIVADGTSISHSSVQSLFIGGVAQNIGSIAPDVAGHIANSNPALVSNHSSYPIFNLGSPGSTGVMPGLIFLYGPLNTSNKFVFDQNGDIQPYYADTNVNNPSFPLSTLQADLGTSNNLALIYGTVADFSLTVAPPPPPPSPIYGMYVHIETGGPRSLNDKPVAIRATPYIATNSISEHDLFVAPISRDETLSEAVAELGYSNLVWKQTVTVPAPSPYRICLVDTCALTDPAVGQISDPAGTYGYDYCNPQSGNYNYEKNYDCTGLYPYYTKQYNFSDLPADPCFSGSLAPTKFIDDRCGGTYVPPADSFLNFTTTLFGVRGNGGPDKELGTFDWTSTYSGYYGETVPLGPLATDSLTLIANGPGGVTLVSVNGVPVPEPSSMLSLLGSLGALAWRRRRGVNA